MLTWSAWRATAFSEQLSFIRQQIEREAEDIEKAAREISSGNLSDESIRVYLLRKRDWLVFELAIKDFENNCADPETLLPVVIARGEKIKNLHYLRRGPFYAVYERDPVDRRVIGLTAYESHCRFIWLMEMMRKYAHISF